MSQRCAEVELLQIQPHNSPAPAGQSHPIPHRHRLFCAISMSQRSSYVNLLQVNFRNQLLHNHTLVGGGAALAQVAALRHRRGAANTIAQLQSEIVNS